ncbi:MAG: NAD(P)-binding domain-containing protein [Burkholderiaceae bacterium]
MGAAIAERLLKHGHEVAVWNRTRTKAEALAAHGALEPAHADRPRRRPADAGCDHGAGSRGAGPAGRQRCASGAGRSAVGADPPLSDLCRLAAGATPGSADLDVHGGRLGGRAR